MSYIGNEPIVSATRTVTEIVATAGQTVFVANGGYTVGYIDVFVNGAQLQASDFTATNGSSVTLAAPASIGDDIRLVAWGTFSTSTAMANVNPSYTGTLTGGTGVVNIGSGQFYKDSSGNVGIGTSSPSNILTLQRSSSSGAVQDIPSLVLSNRNTTNATFVHSGIFADTYRDISNPHYSAGIWFTRVPASGNASSDSNIIFGVATNVSAGALPTERMRIDSSGNLQFNSGYGSVATAYGCRAWVNFTGQGTVAIRASGNVSSLTDHGTGDYTVNFTTSMPDTNYCALVADQTTADNINDPNGGSVIARTSNAYQTGSIRVRSQHNNLSSYYDAFTMNVAIFR